MISATVLSTVLMSASFATADKPVKPESAKNLAAKQCKAEKKADKAAFRSLYGKRAMRTCVKGSTGESKAELKNAAKECKAEQSADPAGFDATYGDPYTSNAFGKCVSSKVRADDEADVEEFANAAKECKAERADDPDGFKETYGTKKGRNALGKCVSCQAAGGPDRGLTRAVPIRVSIPSGYPGIRQRDARPPAGVLRSGP